MERSVCVFAPAKINLFLHVTGRRDNGFHELESLVAFADIGDKIKIEPSNQFEFSINGLFAKSFQGNDGFNQNSVLKAFHAFTRKADCKEFNIRIDLEKNLPLASGIGGGSADAAATIWGLQQLIAEIAIDARTLDDILLSLGSDVPVCYTSSPAIMRGIGDVLTHLSFLPELGIVLANPLKSCPTPDVYAHFKGPFKMPQTLPAAFKNGDELISFLSGCNNSLEASACKIVPSIKNVLSALTAEKGARIARMSGSGATCFALFDSLTEAQMASQNIARNNPDWWVKAGMLNRVSRY